ncbi:LOW QUALITY PROTEIN: sialoadhesin-like [Salminus brasiliensis]|uniref:LOW QUALITY PROTEIN: sialoadhesin-like n=1 Tax=Salminus brasiliensis TaxID=930266 RepID=UPI003B834E41
MMSLRMSLTVPLLFMIFILRAVAQDWSVIYKPKSVCALKGSTVNMACTYTHHIDHRVQKAFWSKDLVTDGEPPDLLEDPEYRGRVQYLGEKHDCNLRLRDVREKDQRKYYFRFLTDEGEKFQGADGVDLSVTDLQVEVPERVIEGGEVTLTCKTTCTLTVRPTFTWYRNGASLSSRTDQLHLQSVSREDGGRYHCAVEGQKLHSPEVTLNVRYPPKSVSVSITPSGKIVEGSSVILTCSSDGNPPVEYTWFKGPSLVATGETFTVKISSVNSGGYKCRSSNEHGEKSSDTVTLNVLYSPKRVSVSISPSGEIVEGSSVTLTCSSDGNPPVQKYTWFKGTSLVATGETFTMKKISSVNSGGYKCRSSNEHGEKSSDTVTLNVLYPPKRVSVSISPSGEIVEGSSVTLTCSGDGNPPVQKYTWFKKVDKEVLQKWTNQIHSITNTRSADSGEYQCMATNTQGSRSSEYKSLTVLYSPKRVSVSISPSGKIVEGSSVILTCSSDGNPPVQKYTWYKGTSLVATGETFTMKKISSLNSGGYKCRSSNEHGEKSSDTVTLDVLYPPKRVSVSISPSGEIVEGSSVTLTCSSDGNPPVQKYTWFKGTSLVATGETFTMKKISSVNSGGYKCRSSNEHGEKSSDTVTLNVLYPPKRVSVSISPSGKMVEGSSVTLTCSSDGNPPVQKYTWFRKADKEVLQKLTNQIYSITNTRSADSGEYQCMATNTQGSRSSEYKSLTVLYSPKRVSVSISPSGKIVEGSSVILTCSSDGNPPVQKYTWYKGTSLVATGETFTMKKISSLNSGGYKCRSSNEHGEKSSDTVTLDVLYPPKRVSVSISPSGEIVEGSSVTLTCSSDGNPPVQKYTWFKGTSLVATGETFTMKKISSVNSGGYKCRSSNEHGEKSSDTVTLNVLYPPKRVSVSISPSGEIVEGSSVTLTCSSDGNPPVQKYTWFRKADKEVLQKWTNQIHSITNTRSADSGEYQCMATNTQGSRPSGYKSLTVLYLQVEVPERVIEGGEVTLTCKTTCSLTVRLTFTWYRNGAPLSSRTDQLHLQSVSREDGGRYHCAVEGRKLHSPEVTLNVRYGPKSISVSISPSGEILQGSSVTLTCSSDGNPPVQNFTWFKEGGSSPVGSGHSYSAVQSGSYYCRQNGPKSVSVSISPSGDIVEGSSVTLTCSSDGNPPVQKYTWFKGASLVATGETFTINKISSVNSGGYKCRSSNEHGEKYSDTVTLNVLYPPKSVSVSISPSGEIVEGSSVTLTCSSDGNPPVQKYTWFKGTSLVATGETFTMKKISSVNSGGYKCRSSNEHGEKYSDTVTLNVLYPPKRVSVSISPSGEIVEGSSVTLTCSSDGNPPVQKYTWFKGTSLVATGETFTMKKISSVNSGGYKCRSSNEHGEKYSDTVTLNVLYPPKSVSVSISPSGKIMEGSSVSLTCSSDGNPPVQKYTWFRKADKEVLQKWTNQIYSITNIRSADSGEYQCMATNTQGSRSSGYKSLTVLYAPKKVWVSISESALSSSVTLTCSSDANPPVQNYTWFKEGGGSPVGSGHSYSAVQSGSYYCVAQNTYGSQTAAAVPVTLEAERSMVLYVGVGVGLCGVAAIMAVVVWLIWNMKKKRKVEEHDYQVSC